MRGKRRAIVPALVLAALAAAASPSPAAAAIQVGQTSPSPSGCMTSNFGEVQQLTAGPPSYVIPSDGVLTSFTVYAPDPDRPVKLLVLSPVSGTTYTVAAKSELVTLPAFGILTFPIQVPVEGGQVIGVFGAVCDFTSGNPGDQYQSFQGPEPANGDEQSFPTASPTGRRIQVSASLEADADCDGLGDETQDSAIDPNGCDETPPETTISNGPKAKTRKKTATFAFTASEPATFDCLLDGKEQFKPCTSPLTIKVKKGKHTFEVRATDAAGNTDSSPAIVNWKVKKKKKK